MTTGPLDFVNPKGKIVTESRVFPVCPASKLSVRVTRSLIAICALLGAGYSTANAQSEICVELSRDAVLKQVDKRNDPSRKPTNAEDALIKSAMASSVESSGYATEIIIVDIDNDGKEDVVAWSIQGTGRFINADVYEMPTGSVGGLTAKYSVELGVLREPHFVGFKGSNYIVATGTGDDDDLSISRISRKAAGQYQRQTHCRTQTTLAAETKCRHPACKTLAALIGNKDKNGPFIEVEWPHKYYSPAGLAAFFSKSSEGDFDNTNNPTSIWRIGRSQYFYHHIYWGLLGMGETMPKVDPKLLPKSNDNVDRRVLPGSEHVRLKRALAQQSEVLSTRLGQKISLPREGEFFLFDANDRTYWAWDFGAPPYGEEIHVTYTNAKKSDYIGMVEIKRSSTLVPCRADCISALEP